MVKIGFICEGETEKIIIASENFQNYLLKNNFHSAGIRDAEGNGNLLPKHIDAHIQFLKDDGAEKIIILTDLDTDLCITKTKERINAPQEVVVIIAVKQIEAWFLSDSITLSTIFGESFHFDFPESEAVPRDTLKRIFIEKTKKGIGPSKPMFAKKMIHHGFSIENAANHTNCHSCKYFIAKLKELSGN